MNSLSFSQLFKIVLGSAALTIAAGCGGDSQAAAAGSQGDGFVEQDGIRMDCSIEPFHELEEGRDLQHGDVVRVTLHVTDSSTGQPVSGLHPGAWLMSRPGVDTPDPEEETTKTVIRKLISSGFEATGSTNLNSWFFATLNTDSTLTLLDPLIDFSRSRMKNVIELPCAGSDLALGNDHLLLFLALPENGEVAVVDTASMTLKESLALGGRPVGLDVQPATGTIWVEDDAGDVVHAIDGRTGKPIAKIEVGPGRKLIAFDDQGQWAFAASQKTGRIVRVGSGDHQAEQLVDLDAELEGLAWSDTAGELYALGRDGSITIIRPDGTTRSSPAVPAGCGPLWSVQGGRFLLCAEASADCVHLIDASVASQPRMIKTGERPTQMACSEQYVYVYCAGSRNLTLIPIAGLAGTAQIAAVQIGLAQKDPAIPANPSGDLLVPAPDRMSALVAAPHEKVVYYYGEGMNAAMGSFQNYSRVPTALAVIDRTMREIAPGVYSTIAPLDQVGTVDLYTYLSQPTQIFGRFDFQVDEDPAKVAKREEMRPGAVPVACDAAPTLQVNRPGVFRFRLEAHGNGQPLPGLEDVRVYVYARYGNWQDRKLARAEADGTYSIELTLPEKGPYRVRVQCPTHRLAYATHRPLELVATDDVEGASAPDPEATTSGGR